MNGAAKFYSKMLGGVLVYLFTLMPFHTTIKAQDLETNELASTLAEEDNSFPTYLKRANRAAKEILENIEEEARAQAHEDLKGIFDKMLKMPEADTCKFENYLQGISVQKPNDNKFTVFTWQYFVNDSTYLYGGYMRLKDGTVFRLDDKAREHKQPFDLKLRHTNWYGALYYKIMPFRHDGQDMYLLFGYNAHSFFARRKLLDVLYFDNGKPRFGFKTIEMKDGRGVKRTVSRFILEYSASVMVTLNYSETEKMILYDHLVGGAPIENGGTLNIPDGSYCGLKLEKGKWIYIDKVHEDEVNPNTTWDNPTAPMPNPIFDNKKSKDTDIFGKQKKKRK